MPKKKGMSMRIPVTNQSPENSLFRTTKVGRKKKKAKVFNRRRKSLT